MVIRESRREYDTIILTTPKVALNYVGRIGGPASLFPDWRVSTIEFIPDMTWPTRYDPDFEVAIIDQEVSSEIQCTSNIRYAVEAASGLTSIGFH